MNQFNYFKILEKDNKELIHSAFISYLLDNNQQFREFLKIPNKKFLPTKLEKQYSLKKEKCRIDIELTSEDQKNQVFVENKFKSFPYLNQLKKYDKIFDSNFAKEINQTKILLCFDKSLILFNSGWNIFDYNDILNFIEKNYDLSKRDDETIFINHYYLFLKEYFENYKAILKNSKNLFDKKITNDDKFWLRLLNSQIVLHFQNKFGLKDFEFLSNPGNTSIPLLNIVPKKWKEVIKEDVLIQFQGKDLKLYIHSSNKEKVKFLIDFCSDKLWHKNIELKKITKRSENSCFIFKINLNDVTNQDYSFTNIIKILDDFYNNIDLKIIKCYNKDLSITTI